MGVVVVVDDVAVVAAVAAAIVVVVQPVAASWAYLDIQLAEASFQMVVDLELHASVLVVLCSMQNHYSATNQPFDSVNSAL